MKTSKADLVDFSRSLVTTGDLDPIYTMLNRSNLTANVKQRWCIAYWLFYHAGVASALAEEPVDQFWSGVRHYAYGSNAPRGVERRHFRAGNAFDAIGTLQAQYRRPNWMIEQLPGFKGQDSAIPLPEMMKAVLAWPQFGPWIAFKVADMVDATLGISVNFNGHEDRFFEAPMKGAWFYQHGDFKESREGFEHASTKDRFLTTKVVCEEVLTHLTDLRCPHADRPLRIQEVETMLCKWKSHLNGHYEVGKDTHEIRKALLGDWGDLARTLAIQLP